MSGLESNEIPKIPVVESESLINKSRLSDLEEAKKYRQSVLENAKKADDAYKAAVEFAKDSKQLRGFLNFHVEKPSHSVIYDPKSFESQTQFYKYEFLGQGQEVGEINTSFGDPKNNNRSKEQSVPFEFSEKIAFSRKDAKDAKPNGKKRRSSSTSTSKK